MKNTFQQMSGDKDSTTFTQTRHKSDSLLKSKTKKKAKKKGVLRLKKRKSDCHSPGHKFSSKRMPYAKHKTAEVDEDIP